jgi:RNA recognition motif-containing protein
MNLYLGNLNYHTREEELRQALEQFGTVDAVRIITDRETRRSKGFGFAEMPNDDEARNAIENFNGQEFGGRQIVVKEAVSERRQRPDAPQRD